MKDLKVNIDFKVNDKVLEKIKANTDCKLVAKATSIGKTKIVIEILEA